MPVSSEDVSSEEAISEPENHQPEMHLAETRQKFEQQIMPHMDSAYNLARWLTGSPTDAEDIIQEAAVRAFRFLPQCKAKQAKSWWLQIVRNTAFTWLRKNRGFAELNESTIANSVSASADPDQAEAAGAIGPGPGLGAGAAVAVGSMGADPLSAMVNEADIQELRASIDQLPIEFREILVLRELDELSYREIAEVAGLPEGTVMSRLNRARKLLKENLNSKRTREPNRRS